MESALEPPDFSVHPLVRFAAAPLLILVNRLMFIFKTGTEFSLSLIFDQLLKMSQKKFEVLFVPNLIHQPLRENVPCENKFTLLCLDALHSHNFVGSTCFFGFTIEVVGETA